MVSKQPHTSSDEIEKNPRNDHPMSLNEDCWTHVIKHVISRNCPLSVKIYGGKIAGGERVHSAPFIHKGKTEIDRKYRAPGHWQDKLVCLCHKSAGV